MWKSALRALAVVYPLLAVAGTVMPSTAVAASRPNAPLKLTTSPLPVTLETTPGKTVTADIKMKQSGGNTEQMKVSLMKFSAYGEQGKPALAERGPGDDYFDWVKFDKPTFTAPNDVWQTIKMTINVPKSGAFSYYYAVVFSRVGDDASAKPGETGFAGGTAVLVLLTVDVPGAKRSVQLQTFAAKHRIVEFLPQSFLTKFFNDGNVYARPSGNIFVTQGSKQVGVLMVNEGQGSVLNNSRRVFETDWSDSFPHYENKKDNGKNVTNAKGEPLQSLSWGLLKPNNPIVTAADHFLEQESQNPLARIRFGQYTAHLIAVYQDSSGRDVPLESSLTFWVVPWRALLVVLLFLLLMGFGVYSIVRSATRRSRIRRKLGVRR
jgi:hypothetical protein